MASKLFANKPLSDKENPNFLSEAALRVHRRNWTDKKNAPKSKIGSPGFVPSDAQAKQVAKMAALGLSVKEIARVTQIEETLLKFYYRIELETSAARTNLAVAHVALKQALRGDSERATQFWLRTRAGWTEKTVVEHQGADAAADEARIAREKLLAD